MLNIVGVVMKPYGYRKTKFNTNLVWLGIFNCEWTKSCARIQVSKPWSYFWFFEIELGIRPFELCIHRQGESNIK